MKNRAKLVLIAMMGGLISSCSDNPTTYSILRSGDTFEQTEGTFNNQLDILFVINDQPSMSSFQSALVTSMNSFMETFITKGFDFKIAVVTSSGYMADPTLQGYDPTHEALADFNDYDGSVYSNMPVIYPEDPNLFENFAINAKPNKNSAGQDGRAFSSMRQALLNTRPINNGFLRPNSFLAVIIVDNAEDFSGNERCNGCNVSGRYDAPTLDPVQTYIDFLNQITTSSGTTARYNVSAMTQIAAPCQGGSNMIRIMDLVERTGGISGDICQPDFGIDMTSIAEQITTLSTQFFLDRVPHVESIRVTINGVDISQSSTDGWSYDPDANSIQFHGTAVPPQDAIIQVDYDPTTVI